MEKNKIILIGGDHYNGLGLVRLFGENGFHPYGIIVGAFAETGFLKESRYWEKVWTIENDLEILRILKEEFSEESERPVIIPWSDGAASIIDLHYDELNKLFILPSIGERQSRIYELMDKRKQIDFARACGLQTAQSYEISLEGKYTLDDVIFPCIGKPIISCEGDKKDIKRIETREDLESYLGTLREKGYKRILLQEYIQLDKEYDVQGFIYKDHYTYFASEKVRTWPNVGGPASYTFSVNKRQLNIEIDKIVAHLEEIGYSGPFDIDFFRVGEQYLFNELNCRNSALCFAAVAAGVNYPLYWYCAVTEQEYTVTEPAEYGAFAMNELLDFQHVKHGEIHLFTWLKQLRNSRAKAYYSKKDGAPLRRRFFMFLRRRVS